MTQHIISVIATLLSALLLPFLTIGMIRKVKARMQGRMGARLFQPLFDCFKWLRKDQTISETTTWVFRASCALNMAIILLIAALVPWISFKPECSGDDLFMVFYLLALMRFMIILSALDSGSAFGAFGSSREAYLGMLTEPALFLSLCSVGLTAHSTDLSVIFDFSQRCSIYDAPVWLAAAAGLYLSSLVDLSRMPIDDPATHLELTMVHEAMTLENSGKNLALVEFTHALKMVVLFGLTTQCLLHALTSVVELTFAARAILSVVGILAVGFVTAMNESVSVKMQWTRTPEFIAYALTMGLFATAGALIGGLYARHGL